MPPVDIHEQQVGDITVLTVRGELDARTLPDATGKLDELFRALRVRLVFNLKATEIVTSTGVGFLVDAAKRTRKFGGDAVLSEPPRLLQRTLTSLKIGDYFKTFPNDADAVAWFRDRDLEDTRPA